MRKEADKIEGYPGLYSRTVVEAESGDGATLPVYVYYKKPELANVQEWIRSGDWLDLGMAEQSGTANAVREAPA